jgi:hypothetical protein
MSEVEAITIQVAPLAADCPRCAAFPGDPCWDDQGRNVVPIHSERHEAMAQHVRDALRVYFEDEVAAVSVGGGGEEK